MMSHDNSSSSTPWSLPSIESSTGGNSSSDSEDFLGDEYSHTSSFLEDYEEPIDPDAEVVDLDSEDLETDDTSDSVHDEEVVVDINPNIPFISNIPGMSNAAIDGVLLPLQPQIGDSFESCPICFTDEDQHLFRQMLCCRAPFHYECIRKWLSNTGRCPACNRAPRNYDV